MVLLMVKLKLWAVLMRDLGPMMGMSDLSQLSLRKSECIHDFILVKQLVRVQ